MHSSFEFCYRYRRGGGDVSRADPATGSGICSFCIRMALARALGRHGASMYTTPYFIAFHRTPEKTNANTWLTAPAAEPDITGKYALSKLHRDAFCWPNTRGLIVSSGLDTSHYA